ncbi:MAG: hypothetical protein ABSE93_20030 [Terriglobia bacterium]|jgi:hypothetical protein
MAFRIRENGLLGNGEKYGEKFERLLRWKHGGGITRPWVGATG